MKTWHIRVVDRHGQPLTQLRVAALRAELVMVPAPPLAAVAPFGLPAGESTVLLLGWVAVWATRSSRFHPQHQFLHDALAGTRLVPAVRPVSA